MARLYRPHIPLKVRVAVASRQLSELGDSSLINCIAFASSADHLDILLAYLCKAIGCPRDQLRLDHDPPLGGRPKTGDGKRTVYTPSANDPDHLFYRPHGPEFDGSHLIKTNVRGDHGQHPDRVLIKKQKRLERGPRPKRQPGFKTKAPKTKWPSRPFASKRKTK